MIVAEGTLVLNKEAHRAMAEAFANLWQREGDSAYTTEFTLTHTASILEASSSRESTARNRDQDQSQLWVQLFPGARRWTYAQGRRVEEE